MISHGVDGIGCDVGEIEMHTQKSSLAYASRVLEANIYSFQIVADMIMTDIDIVA